MEKLRLNFPLFEFDTALREEFGVICGIDEAGRGCLAGDVFAAAVVFDQGVEIPGLGDSKKLTARRREYLYGEIVAKARAYAIAAASIEEIEEINILNAALLAMKRAFISLHKQAGGATVQSNRNQGIDYRRILEVRRLKGRGLATGGSPIDVVLIDGNKSPELDVKSLTVVKGDGKSATIAAASILAKVARDRYMGELDKLYPEYRFAAHKGYGTRLHYAVIREHGICTVHRKSFFKKNSNG